MTTLAHEKINITLPCEISEFFRRRAREANTTVDRVITTMAWTFMGKKESLGDPANAGAFDAELPQWEKDFIDQRLDMTRRHPDRLKPVAALFETL